MLKQGFALLMVIVLINQLCGCSTIRSIPLRDIERDIKGQITVHTYQEEVITCDKFAPSDLRLVQGELRSSLNASRVISDTLYSYVSGQSIRIPIDRVQKITISELDLGKSAVLVGYIIMGSLLLWYISQPTKARLAFPAIGK